MKDKLNELILELDDKKLALDGLKGFAFKFVSELYKHIKNKDDKPIHDLFFHLNADKNKNDKEDGDDDNSDNDIGKLFKTYSKNKANQGQPALRNSFVKRGSIPSAENHNSKAPFIPTFKTDRFRRSSLGVQMIEEDDIETEKVVRLKMYTNLKKKMKVIGKGQIEQLMAAQHKNGSAVKTEEPEDINSDINESVLEELDDSFSDDPILVDAKGTKTRKRDFTTIKISFKIDIQNAPTKPSQTIAIKKDRVYKIFHLREIEFHFDKKGLCGVQLTFYDKDEDALFIGEMHGIQGSEIERIRFEMNELIDKIKFASDHQEIHSIEIETTLGRVVVIGKSRKEAMAIGLQYVNRYFSDKEMLYSFFACFNKLTKRIAFLRFLFVRKNKLKF